MQSDSFRRFKLVAQGAGIWYTFGMKTCAKFLFSALFALVTMECAAMPCCRTLKPNPAALAWRAALSGGRVPETPSLRAAVRADVQQPVVDVLVAYDLSAQKWLADNGKGAPLEYAKRKVEEMNGCLRNSLIDTFKFRLVGTVCIGADATQYRDSLGYVDLDFILSGKLVNEWGDRVASGEWAKITDAREELGADVVSVLVDSGRYGTVGLGYALEDDYVNKYSRDSSQIPSFGDWAYNVCSISIVDESHSMLHEIGHNMGCGHPDGSCASAFDMDLGPQLYSFSAGYYAWIGDEGYYTIMGYNFGGFRPDGSYDPYDRFTELPYFSSPLLTYEGVPLGTAFNDNRRTILATGAYVAKYRAAKVPVDAEPEHSGDEDTPSRVFPTEFRPVKAVNGTAPYVGVVYDSVKPVGILSLKCAKAATSGKNAGKSKVSAVVIGLDGKQKKSSAEYVTCGYDAKAKLVVKDWGTLSLTLGGEGFTGALGDGMTVKTATVGGALSFANSVVDVDFKSGTGVLPAGVLEDLLPTGDHAEPVLQKGGKWAFAKAAQIKYKKITDRATKAVRYELQGADDPAKPNLSAMKLAYTPKKGTFKGTFKVYALEPSGTRLKLKKHSAKVSGIVVDGVGRGIAVIGKTGNFPVIVSHRDSAGTIKGEKGE